MMLNNLRFEEKIFENLVKFVRNFGFCSLTHLEQTTQSDQFWNNFMIFQQTNFKLNFLFE
jgi:hypothetical protein